MEKIVKTIKIDKELVEINGENKFIISTGSSYNFNILLKSEHTDFGYFDGINNIDLVETTLPPTTEETTEPPLSPTTENTTLEPTTLPEISTTDGNTETLNAPTSVTAIPTSGDLVGVTWNDVSNNENGFEIQVRVGSGSFIDAGSVGSNVTDFNYDVQDLYNNNLVNGDTLVHRVRSFNANGMSAWVEADPISFGGGGLGGGTGDGDLGGGGSSGGSGDGGDLDDGGSGDGTNSGTLDPAIGFE